ncbi:hypothetical protein PTSG_03693 [Salpingoeca rosetta]|uniref:Uncharacterized protein n=1 Tax=Salpingoeca rosetta (strain ATCC 50818 / BSB-021) TaxID=946362 RepID=F2U6B4_SALR5|nr:uncharacterized protein PTSG_03693 [Salpingoeca rosetta]EGD83055.1 hypothetical protein PTSG_03693 [Salpingoeca rosetta]|eukprot:XP_004995419.1 hypothetical protein PTSG_03693 [Salpingoeca rosetta]
MTPAPTGSHQRTVYIAHNKVETGPEALALQHQLCTLFNHKVIASPARRNDPEAATAACAGIQAADVIVLLGSKLLGQRTSDIFSSHDELRYILQASIPIVLVHMCHRFKYRTSQHVLSISRSHSCAWLPHTLSASLDARKTPPQQVLHTIKSALTRRRAVSTRGILPLPPRVPTPQQQETLTAFSTTTTLSTLYEDAETSSVDTGDDGERGIAKPCTGEVDSDSQACVHRLLSDIQKHMSRPEEATAALAALVACSIESPTSIVRCVARDQLAVNTVLGAMRAHPRVRELQRLGCRILDSVVSFLFTARKQRQHHQQRQLDTDTHDVRRLLRERASEPVLAAMWHHQGDEAIQAYGCGVLRRLVRDPDVQHGPLLRVGMLAAVATAMHTHTPCKVLTKLTLTSDKGDALVREIVDLGILEALAEALQCHPTDAAVVRAACQFSQVLLQALCTPSDRTVLPDVSDASKLVQAAARLALVVDLCDADALKLPTA